MTTKQKLHLDRKWMSGLKREFQFNKMYREKFGREKALPLPR